MPNKNTQNVRVYSLKTFWQLINLTCSRISKNELKLYAIYTKKRTKIEHNKLFVVRRSRTNNRLFGNWSQRNVERRWKTKRQSIIAQQKAIVTVCVKPGCYRSRPRDAADREDLALIGNVTGKQLRYVCRSVPVSRVHTPGRNRFNIISSMLLSRSFTC